MIWGMSKDTFAGVWCCKLRKCTFDCLEFIDEVRTEVLQQHPGHITKIAPCHSTLKLFM